MLYASSTVRDSVFVQVLIEFGHMVEQESTKAQYQQNQLACSGFTLLQI